MVIALHWFQSPGVIRRSKTMDTLIRDYDERAIRKRLRDHLIAEHGAEPETVYIDELGVNRGSGRIDLAVVNGQLHGYEIKSDRDSLRRLKSQSELYSGVFDRITLVCGEKHISRALDIIPGWWALARSVTLNDALAFEMVRIGQANPNRNRRALAELLWRDEVISILETRDAVYGLRRKPRAILWDKIAEVLSVDEMAEAVRRHLKATSTVRGRPEQPS